MEKTLMHTCCAPCSVSCIQQLRAEGIEPVSFWYNPNIHPFQEYKARRETLEAYAPTMGMELIVREEYGLRDFVRAVADDIEGRCRHCYRVRLEETARYAAEHGYTSFTSTPLRQPLSESRASAPDGGGARAAVRRAVSLPRLPPGLSRRTAAGARAGLLHAEILRLRLQRGGPLRKADPPRQKKITGRIKARRSPREVPPQKVRATPRK